MVDRGARVSEADFADKLQRTRHAFAGESTKVACCSQLSGGVAVGRGVLHPVETYVIEDVVSFAAKLETNMFCDVKILCQSHVEVVRTGTTVSNGPRDSRHARTRNRSRIDHSGRCA